MEEEIKKTDLAKGALALLLMIILSIMALTIAGLREQLNELQQKTNQDAVSQQAQIDGLALNIETVRNDMNAGFDDQQKQLDIQAEQIRTTKQNLHNTNQAFTSFRKQQNRVEEELREELKKD